VRRKELDGESLDVDGESLDVYLRRLRMSAKLLKRTTGAYSTPAIITFGMRGRVRIKTIRAEKSSFGTAGR
jgi:hypothetical protein